MESRASEVRRKTKETDISVRLTIDGTGKSSVEVGIPLFKHLLEGFAKHGLFDLDFRVAGDLEVGQHHTIEDTGIALGEAFRKALRDARGIERAGHSIFPMDDSLSLAAVDIGGRPYLRYDAGLSDGIEGDLERDALKEFFAGFANGLRANIYIKTMHGDNDHHKLESVFKAFGKSMKAACTRNERAINSVPSTKGSI